MSFYWFSSEISPAAYNYDFQIMGTASLSGASNASVSGSGSVTLTGDGSKTVFDKLKIRTIFHQIKEPPEKVFFILSPGTGYTVDSLSRHKQVLISEEAETTARYVLSARDTGVIGHAIYPELMVERRGEVYSVDHFSWQSRNYGSSDSWEEISSARFCTVKSRRDICYKPTLTDLDKEIRLTVTYTSDNNIIDTIVSNVIGPIKKNSVGFEKQQVNVAEGDDAEVKLLLAHERETDLTVRVSATPLTATGNGVDYTGQTFEAEFEAGQKEASIFVPTTRDNTDRNDGEAATETARLDIHDFDFPDDLEKDSSDLCYLTIHNYEIPVVTLDSGNTTVDEGDSAIPFTIRADRGIDPNDPLFVSGKAVSKDGKSLTFSSRYYGVFDTPTIHFVGYVPEDTYFCAYLIEPDRGFTVESQAKAQPPANWNGQPGTCPSGATLLVRDLGQQSREQLPEPDRLTISDPIKDCIYTNGAIWSEVEHRAKTRNPADDRFNRILSALYERATPEPLTSGEAEVYYRNNMGGVNETFFKNVVDTLECVEAL